MDEAAAASDSATPLVSVVIPSVNGLPVLAECLQALVQQQVTVPVEILVVDRCGEETRAVVRNRFPQVRLIPVEGRPSIPALRALGIEQARGQVVAITEDHCIANPGWFQAIARAHQAGYQAIGGPVENGSVERAVDWAVFFCEYARFMAPVAHGVVHEIPGNNSAYDRRLLEALGPELRAEVWDSFLHARMRELGVVFHSDPEMIMLHKKEFGYVYFLSQRFHYSRSFAGMRLTGARWWKRAFYAAATLALPAVLLGRITATVVRKGRHVREFVRSLPALCTFVVSWAVGEWVGAVLGPGHSLRYVE